MVLETDVYYNEDCLDTMSRMPDGCVDLVVTSPPYDDMRDYNGYSFDFENIAKELYRVIKDGGVVVWVVGDQTKDGDESGTSFKQALFFKSIGFKLHDTMIYIKKGGVNTGSLEAYQQKFEYMFVFVKGKIRTFNPIRDRENKYVDKGRVKMMRQKDGTFKPQRFKSTKLSIRYNYWTYLIGNHKGQEYKHPAQFPEDLAKDHIISWSNEGDLVYDPFAGSGTTLAMARLLKRRYIGSEISEEYCDIIKDRLARYIHQRDLTQWF